MEHTKGPWTATQQIIDGRLSDIYVICGNTGEGEEENVSLEILGEANAQLIAAAPELLWACEALEEALNKAGGCRAPMFLSKVIAKAKGE